MNSEILERVERLAILNRWENVAPNLFLEESIKEREDIINHLKDNNILEISSNGHLQFIGEHSEKYDYLYIRRYNGL